MFHSVSWMDIQLWKTNGNYMTTTTTVTTKKLVVGVVYLVTQCLNENQNVKLTVEREYICCWWSVVVSVMSVLYYYALAFGSEIF